MLGTTSNEPELHRAVDLHPGKSFKQLENTFRSKQSPDKEDVEGIGRPSWSSRLETQLKGGCIDGVQNEFQALLVKTAAAQIMEQCWAQRVYPIEASQKRTRHHFVDSDSQPLIGAPSMRCGDQLDWRPACREVAHDVRLHSMSV